MAGAGARHLSLRDVEDDLDHRDEASRRDLRGDDLVRGGEKRAGIGMLAGERAEDVLRHRHVGGRVDAVTGDVAEDDGEPAVAEREVVVDVAADLEPCGRLVDVAELEPGQLRGRAREQRALHRVRERLLLAVEAGVVDRERRLAGDRERGLGDLAGHRAIRMERDDRHRRQQLARRRDGDQRSARALAQEGSQQRQRAAERLGQVGVEEQRLAAPKQGGQGAERQRLRAREQHPRGRIDPLVVDVHGPGDQLDPAFVGHPDHGRVDAEQVDDGGRQCVERRLQ